MPESKKLIVFAIDKRNKRKPNSVGMELYAFSEEDFSPVGNEQGKPSVEACCPDEITDPSRIFQPLIVLNHCHRLQSYASLWGRVYCIGGSRLSCNACLPMKKACPSEDVYCWDAIHNCLTSSPPMNVGRRLCDLHVLQGKLYVTGRIFSRRKEKFVFIERLDESKGRWAVLPYPPHYVKLHLHHFLSAAVESKGFILFGSEACEYFYAYTPPHSWRLMVRLRVDPIILFGQPLYSLTVTENHLLWLNGHDGLTIVGFDHNDGHYFEIGLVFEGVLPDGALFGFPRLVYAGNGVLALVWSDDVCVQGSDGLLRGYHCSRFSIYFVNGGPRVKKLSHQSCVGPEYMQTLLHAFSVDLDVPVGNLSNSNTVVEAEG